MYKEGFQSIGEKATGVYQYIQELDKIPKIQTAKQIAEAAIGIGGLVGEFIIWPQPGISSLGIPFYGGAAVDGMYELTKQIIHNVKASSRQPVINTSSDQG